MDPWFISMLYIRIKRNKKEWMCSGCEKSFCTTQSMIIWYARHVWTKSLGSEFMLLDRWIQLCPLKFSLLTWKPVYMVWIPLERLSQSQIKIIVVVQVMNLNCKSNLGFVCSVVWLFLYLDFRGNDLVTDWLTSCLLCEWFPQWKLTWTCVSLATNSLVSGHQQQWTATPWFLLIHFLPVPFVSHLRSWASQCILPCTHKLGMLPALEFKKWSASSCWLWQIRWVISSTGHRFHLTEPLCSMHKLSQSMSILSLILAYKQWLPASMMLFICLLTPQTLLHYKPHSCIILVILNDKVFRLHQKSLQLPLNYMEQPTWHRFLTALHKPCVSKHWIMAWQSLVHLFMLSMSMMMV